MPEPRFLVVRLGSLGDVIHAFPAVAALRGDASVRSPLRFVRFEPLVVPKRALTGDSAERVDTRVLQVVYELERTDQRFFVDQQMDVFIDDAKGRL